MLLFLPMHDSISKIINLKVFMSPMSGITDLPFRTILQKHGCRFMFTEMIDANGLFYNNFKTMRMLNRAKDTYTYGVQLIGSDEEKILRAANICEDKGFSILELNAACPVHKVTKDGKGSALLKDLKKLQKIISCLVKGIKIPLTVKIRSGWDNSNLNYLKSAKIIEETGASAICIHPRTKLQMYKDMPCHEITRAVKETVKIPVFASGDIFSTEDVNKVFKSTNCDAISIARGALGRPWIFKQIYSGLNGSGHCPAPSFDEIKSIITEHLAICLEFFDAKRAFLRMYKHCNWYFKEYGNRHFIMQKYREIHDFEQFKHFMDRLCVDGDKKLYLKGEDL